MRSISLIKTKEPVADIADDAAEKVSPEAARATPNEPSTLILTTRAKTDPHEPAGLVPASLHQDAEIETPKEPGKPSVKEPNRRRSRGGSKSAAATGKAEARTRAEPELDQFATEMDVEDTSPGRNRKNRRDKSGPAPQDVAPIIIRPVAPMARPRRRHWLIMLSFALMVIAPAVLVAGYLWTYAVDQYGSTVGFSVRSEESAPSASILGQLSQLSGASSADTDLLYEFIQSQELVSKIDAKIDLVEIYSRYHDLDPVFAYDSTGTIEDLVDYWARMISIAYDPGTGLMEVTVKAFDPLDAQRIAQDILDESALRVNELSAIAREDATRYAREELNKALDRLATAREAVTAYRLRTQIVDPTADIQSQMGLLNTLQVQLATALIDLDLLRETTREGDPRVLTLERRVEVIQARIDEERSVFGAGGKGPGGEDYATIVADFERLDVDRQFAETSYVTALSTYDNAVLSAQRTSRYLAAHVKPTRAESSRYPQRGIIFGVTVLFAFLLWGFMVVIYYSIRDRR
jgi:capsular polysaccharide transport system permease protein